MQDPLYYREEAAHARRLAKLIHQQDITETLIRTAQDFEDIAEDLETGAIEIRHPELMRQPSRDR